MEIEITYTPALIGVGAEVGDDVDASCDAFEVQVHREVTASYPDADVTVTRDHGHLADLSVVTHGVEDRPGVLTVRQAVWSDVWDLISPYGRYRRALRDVKPLPAKVATRKARRTGTDMLVEDADGIAIIEVDEDEVLAVMRSGFGVAIR